MSDCYVDTGYWDDGYTEQDVCGIGPPPVVRRGDDAFISNGQRERFWRRQAEEQLEELLDRAEEVADAPRKTRRRVAERFEALEWEKLPDVPRVADLMATLRAKEPDDLLVAGLVLQIREEIELDRIRQRRKRDIEAILVLM